MLPAPGESVTKLLILRLSVKVAMLEFCQSTTVHETFGLLSELTLRLPDRILRHRPTLHRTSSNNTILRIGVHPDAKLSQRRVLAPTLSAFDVPIASRKPLTHQALGSRANGAFHRDMEDQRRFDGCVADYIRSHGPGDTDRPPGAVLVLHKLSRKVDSKSFVADSLRAAHARVVECPAEAFDAVIVLCGGVTESCEHRSVSTASDWLGAPDGVLVLRLSFVVPFPHMSPIKSVLGMFGRTPK